MARSILAESTNVRMWFGPDLWFLLDHAWIDFELDLVFTEAEILADLAYGR